MMRPFYFAHGVIEVYTKNGVKYYVAKTWSDDAMNQSVIESKPLGEETPEEIAKRVQQMLGSVNGE